MPRRSKPKNWYEGLDDDTKAIVLGIGFVIFILVLAFILSNPILAAVTFGVLGLGLFTIYSKYKTGKWWFRAYERQRENLDQGRESSKPTEEVVPRIFPDNAAPPPQSAFATAVAESVQQHSPISFSRSVEEQLPKSFDQLDLDQKVDHVINAIQNFIPPHNPSNELSYQDMLVSNLMRDYPAIKQRQQFGNNEIDAVVGRIGIEAKLWLRKGEADRVFGQIESFLQYLDRVVVVLYQPAPEWQNYLKQKLVRHGWLPKTVRVVTVS